MRYVYTALLFVFAVASFAANVEPLEIGAKAPDFSLMGVDSNMYSLDDFKDSDILVVIFTANHCPTAQAYEDRIIELTRDNNNKSVAVVAISSNHPPAVRLDELAYSDLGDSFKDMQIRANEKGYNFPYLYDGDTQETALAYGPQATPHVFIFDQNRKLRYQGRFDDTENPYVEPKTRDTRNAIEALLAGEPVPVQTTKVFGCSMKWKEKVEWVKKGNQQWRAKPVTLEMIDSAGVAALVENKSDNLLLINVWATWCGPCVVEFPELVKLYRIYSGREFDMVSVSADKPSQHAKALKFLKERNAAFRNVHFSGDVYSLIDVLDPEWSGPLPHTVMIKPGGEVVYRHTGLIDPLEIRKLIVGYLGRYYADQ